jgi:hypothetical protein
MDIERMRDMRGEDISYTQEIPDTPEMRRLRRSLSGLPKKNPNYPTMDGIELIQKTSERGKGEDCELFIFPEYWKPGNLSLNEVLLHWENGSLKPHAIACYFDKEGNFMHVGRVNEQRRILSKWGMSGNVYLHKPELVPIHYGNTIMYFINEVE